MIDEIIIRLKEAERMADKEADKRARIGDLYGEHLWVGFRNGIVEALTIIQEMANDEPDDIDCDLGYDPF